MSSEQDKVNGQQTCFKVGLYAIPYDRTSSQCVESIWLRAEAVNKEPNLYLPSAQVKLRLEIAIGQQVLMKKSFPLHERHG